MIELIKKPFEGVDKIKECSKIYKIEDLNLDDIDPFSNSKIDLTNYFESENKESELNDLNPFKEKISILPRNGGEWSGEVGNSKWIPEGEKIPQKQVGINPDRQTWKEILKEFSIDGINFKEREPNFSEISKQTIEISDFTTDRTKNFIQANEITAEKRGCSPDDVEDWMDENKYTWHERSDCKTMDKVPSKVHNFISHSGGISKEKNKL